MEGSLAEYSRTKLYAPGSARDGAHRTGGSFFVRSYDSPLELVFLLDACLNLVGIIDNLASQILDVLVLGLLLKLRGESCDLLEEPLVNLCKLLLCL